MNEHLKWGARVVIGGATMLRPGFSLVGLEGLVVPDAPNLPPNCVTVAVDWEAGGYTVRNGFDPHSLPMFVNVPAEHLEAAEAETARPALSMVKDDAPAPTEPSAETPAAESRPQLRLI